MARKASPSLTCMSCDSIESENSPAVILVGPNGISTTPANDLPEASEDTFACT